MPVFKGMYLLIAGNKDTVNVQCTCYSFPEVRVKWGREKFEGVEVNTDEAPAVFKSQLFSLSGQLIRTANIVYQSVIICVLIIGVPPERQKVMIGGATLQDDDWGKAKPKIKEVCPYILYRVPTVQLDVYLLHM